MLPWHEFGIVRGMGGTVEDDPGLTAFGMVVMSEVVEVVVVDRGHVATFGIVACNFSCRAAAGPNLCRCLRYVRRRWVGAVVTVLKLFWVATCRVFVIVSYTEGITIAADFLWFGRHRVSRHLSRVLWHGHVVCGVVIGSEGVGDCCACFQSA